jgi:hypothetical protein
MENFSFFNCFVIEYQFSLIKWLLLEEKKEKLKNSRDSEVKKFRIAGFNGL